MLAYSDVIRNSDVSNSNVRTSWILIHQNFWQIQHVSIPKFCQKFWYVGISNLQYFKTSPGISETLICQNFWQNSDMPEFLIHLGFLKSSCRFSDMSEFTIHENFWKSDMSEIPIYQGFQYVRISEFWYIGNLYIGNSNALEYLAEILICQISEIPVC